MKRRQVILLGFVSLISIVFLIIYLFNTVNSPASGTIYKNGQAKPAPPRPRTALFNGASVSFIYSTNYTTHAVTKSSGYLDAVLLLANNSNNQITVTVISESIGNDSGVSYRRQDPGRYHETSLANGLVFVSTSPGFERTVYISHAGLVISISALSSAGEDLTADSQQIVQSLAWKQ